MNEEGLTYAHVGEDLWVNQSSIPDWRRRAEPGGQQRPGQASRKPSMGEARARLRREHRSLRQERELRKRAAAFFANETL